jgi:hypothetical protein
MAVAVDSASHAETTSSQTTSPALSATPAGSDRVIVIGVTWFGDQNISAITFGGSATGLTQLAAVSHSGDARRRAYLYGLHTPGTGAQAIVITAAAAVADWAVGYICFTGAHQSAAFGTPSSVGDSASTSVTSGSVTGTADGLIVDLFACWFDARGGVPGAGQTGNVDVPEWGGNGAGFGMSTKNATGATTTSWTFDNAGGTAVVVAVPVLAAGSSQGPRSSAFLRMLMNN